MRAFSRSLVMATVVLAGLLVAPRAEALCTINGGYWPCPIVYTCNNDSVCKFNTYRYGVSYIEDIYSCPSDCPCAHDTCVTGAPLNAGCQNKIWIVAAVCSYMSRCCTESWDQQCVNEANAWGALWVAYYGLPGNGCFGNYNPGSY